MQIKKKILIEFLRKTKMEGEQSIDECILNFAKDGLKINVNSPAKQSRVMSWLKKQAFEKYDEIGQIAVNELDKIIKVLDRFSDKITLKKIGNVLEIKGEGKKVDIELVSEALLSEDVAPKLEFDETFTISAEKLSDIFKDVQMNKDAVLKLKTEKNKVLISNTGKYKFLTELTALECKGGSTVEFGKAFIDSLTNLTGILELSVKNQYPCKVLEKMDNSVITIIVAPRVSEEE